MKFTFRPRTTLVCLALMAGMLRLSYWQWERHQDKLVFIAGMDARLQQSPAPLTELLAALPAQPTAADWQTLHHRRVLLSGSYDFEHEMILRNRRLDGAAGVYVITPLKLDGTNTTVLVNRGFLPLTRSTPELRKEFQRPATANFIGLVKDTSEQKFLAPSDPETGPGLPWVDAWLRVDSAKMQRQLPYSIPPIHLEIMDTQNLTAAKERIVHTEKGKEELLFLGARGQEVARPDFRQDLTYPVPVFDTVLPPGRHLGYVYEWGFMALVTGLIGLGLQLRQPRTNGNRRPDDSTTEDAARPLR